MVSDSKLLCNEQSGQIVIGNINRGEYELKRGTSVAQDRVYDNLLSYFNPNI
jgi:hypothetical protein